LGPDTVFPRRPAPLFRFSPGLLRRKLNSGLQRQRTFCEKADAKAAAATNNEAEDPEQKLQGIPKLEQAPKIEPHVKTGHDVKSERVRPATVFRFVEQKLQGIPRQLLKRNAHVKTEPLQEPEPEKVAEFDYLTGHAKIMIDGQSYATAQLKPVGEGKSSLVVACFNIQGKEVVASVRGIWWDVCQQWAASKTSPPVFRVCKRRAIKKDKEHKAKRLTSRSRLQGMATKMSNKETFFKLLGRFSFLTQCPSCKAELGSFPQVVGS